MKNGGYSLLHPPLVHYFLFHQCTTVKLNGQFQAISSTSLPFNSSART
jgi:hypothetical protein